MFEKTLQDVVKGIRANKRNPKPYISQVIAECKRELQDPDVFLKAQAIRKLTYLQMLGYDMSWAAFQVVEVMSSSRFAHKRIGYLAACQSFDRDTEVVLLTTNHLKKEFNAANQYDVGQAINCLANIVNKDLARDLLSDLVQLMSHSKPYVRKKAVLAMYKMFMMYPQGLRLTFDRLKDKLGDAEAPVVSCAVNVICELANKNPKNYLSMAPQFFRLLTTSSNNWMLIKVVKLLGSLVPEEPRLARKLLEPLATIIQNTAAKSLQYECIYTVTLALPYTKRDDGSESRNVPAVVRLCSEQLRTFVEDSDQNLKYLGLVGFVQLMHSHPKAVIPHRDLVLQCLNDDDVTIRLRALELLTGMVNKRNLEELVHKLLRFTVVAEGTYRDELINKIVFMCSRDKYANLTDFAWYLSVLVDLATVQGSAHGKLVASQLMDVALRVGPVRPFAVESVMSLLLDGKLMLSQGQATFYEVLSASSWIVGEYAPLISEVVASLADRHDDDDDDDDDDDNDDDGGGSKAGRKEPVMEEDGLMRNRHGAIKFPAAAPYKAAIRALTHPRATNLPPHVQASYIQNATKVFVAAIDRAPDAELTAILDTFKERLNIFSQSVHIEVQERTSTLKQLLIAQNILKESSPPPEAAQAGGSSDGGADDGDEGAMLESATSAESKPADSASQSNELLDLMSAMTAPSTPAAGTGTGSAVAPTLDTTASSSAEAVFAIRNSSTLFKALVAEPMDPVNPKAQRRVPRPQSINFDAPIDKRAVRAIYALEDGDHKPMDATAKISFTEFKFTTDSHDFAMDAFGSEFTGIGGGGPGAGGAGGGSADPANSSTPLHPNGDDAANRPQIFSSYDRTDPFYIRSVNPEDVEVDDIPVLKLAPEDLEGPRGRRKKGHKKGKGKDRSKKVEYSVNVDDAMPTGFDDHVADSGRSKQSPSKTVSAFDDADLSMVDLTTPLRADETLPEMKHREVPQFTAPPEQAQGQAGVGAEGGKDERKKSKKSKGEKKKSKKDKSSSSKGGSSKGAAKSAQGPSGGMLLDLMDFGGGGDVSTSAAPPQQTPSAHSSGKKSKKAGARPGADGPVGKFDYWMPINLPSASGIIRAATKTAMSTSKQQQVKITIRITNLTQAPISSVGFELTTLSPSLRPVKGLGAAISSPIAPGQSGEATLSCHCGPVPDGPIQVAGAIRFVSSGGGGPSLLGFDDGAGAGQQVSAPFQTVLPACTLLSPTNVNMDQFAAAIGKMQAGDSTKLTLRTPNVDPIATIAGVLHGRVVSRDKKATSVFGTFPSGDTVGILLKVKSAHIGVDIKSSNPSLVALVRRDLDMVPM